ncbi:hypothetical protein ATANTOWER_023053 [Ataeniobius toweri]|uniref:Uncharacterized protein n=1 Tax=Ataeniobius toweri TaxID=208326 RepID=A0ABU7A7R7_9TELE|nr:hypothetical protein [Ataeniobius toweri]
MQSSINSRKSPITCPNNHGNGAVTVRTSSFQQKNAKRDLCLHTMRDVCGELQKTNNYLNDISDSNLTGNKSFVSSYLSSSTMSQTVLYSCCIELSHSSVLIIIMT